MKKLIVNCLFGLLIVALGVFILIQPNAFLKTLVLIFGIYILIEGLSSIIYSFKLRSFKHIFRLSLVKALLNFAVGLLVCYFTITTTDAQVTTWVVYLIATELMVSGVLTILDTIFLKKVDVLGLGFYLGSDIAVSMIFAILLYMFPAFIGTTVITILGVIVLLVGAGMFFSGILVYSKVKHVAKKVEKIEGEFTQLD